MIKYIRPYHLVLLLAVICCRKPYTPKVIEVDYSYLVIDGVINVGTGTVTTIQLSRTRQLTDTAYSNPESGGSVLIEAQSGGTYPLVSQGNGVYTSSPLTLSTTGNYRLKVTDRNGDSYISDYASVKQTPPIDSLSWKQDTADKAVTIYAHTHDPSNKTIYYRWDYVETWMYRAPLDGSWGLNNRTIYYLDVGFHVYECWSTHYSDNISVATSNNLSQDVISYAPIQKLVQNDQRLMVRYSINAKQYGLSKEAYTYWQTLEKSSQQTGTIFDPQPSQLNGNFHCVNDPSKPVIGYASAAVVTEKRIFIDHQDLFNWVKLPIPDLNCELFRTDQDPNDFSRFNYYDTTWGPYYYSGSQIVIAKKDCLDCRRKGGTNIKPAFWQ